MRRRDRLNYLANTICRGKRHEAADLHDEAARVAAEVTGLPCKVSRSCFLAGWDEAMKLKADELREENDALHSMVLALCARLCLRRCETCQGLGSIDLEDCPHCQGGWVDVPGDEPERIVREVKERS